MCGVYFPTFPSPKGLSTELTIQLKLVIGFQVRIKFEFTMSSLSFSGLGIKVYIKLGYERAREICA